MKSEIMSVLNAPTPVNPSAIQVRASQKGNPVLSCIRNVQWEMCQDIVPDYILGSGTCALFLSVKFHLLHPSYIFRRMKEIGRSYRLRVVICLVDVEDNVKPLLELNKLCFNNQFTLILSWSNKEAGRYLETLKAYESKPSTSIQEKVEDEFLPQITKSLKNIPSVNKTDVLTMLQGFQNLSGICAADEQQLLLCPGLGEKKVRRIYQALHTPFKKQKKCVPSSSDYGKSIPKKSQDDNGLENGKL